CTKWEPNVPFGPGIASVAFSPHAKWEEKGWSSRQLAEQVSREVGSRGATGGPNLKAPEDLSEALDQVAKHTEEWLKRYDGLWARDRSWPPRRGFGDEELSTLAGRLRELRGRLERLEVESRVLGERLRKIERGIRGNEARAGPRGLPRGGARC